MNWFYKGAVVIQAILLSVTITMVVELHRQIKLITETQAMQDQINRNLLDSIGNNLKSIKRLGGLK